MMLTSFFTVTEPLSSRPNPGKKQNKSRSRSHLAEFYARSAIGEKKNAEHEHHRTLLIRLFVCKTYKVLLLNDCLVYVFEAILDERMLKALTK